VQRRIRWRRREAPTKFPISFLNRVRTWGLSGKESALFWSSLDYRALCWCFLLSAEGESPHSAPTRATTHQFSRAGHRSHGHAGWIRPSLLLLPSTPLAAEILNKSSPPFSLAQFALCPFSSPPLPSPSLPKSKTATTVPLLLLRRLQPVDWRLCRRILAQPGQAQPSALAVRESYLPPPFVRREPILTSRRHPENHRYLLRPSILHHPLVLFASREVTWILLHSKDGISIIAPRPPPTVPRDAIESSRLLIIQQDFDLPLGCCHLPPVRDLSILLRQ